MPFSFRLVITASISPSGNAASSDTFIQAQITDVESPITVKIESTEKNNLALTASENIAAVPGTTIAVNKGQTAYYTTTVTAQQDDAHMALYTHDETHMAAINIKITVSEGDGYIALPDGNYYLHLSLKAQSKGRLSNTVAAGADDDNVHDEYVDGSKTVYVPFEVSGGHFDPVSLWAALSITGTTTVADAGANVPSTDWEMVINTTQPGASEVGAKSNAIIARA